MHLQTLKHKKRKNFNLRLLKIIPNEKRNRWESIQQIYGFSECTREPSTLPHSCLYLRCGQTLSAHWGVISYDHPFLDVHGPDHSVAHEGSEAFWSGQVQGPKFSVLPEDVPIRRRRGQENPLLFRLELF